jgi:hypothetical protein
MAKTDVANALCLSEASPIDYKVAGNCATRLFGTAQMPPAVKFIQETMAQRGLAGLNPGMLQRGRIFLRFALVAAVGSPTGTNLLRRTRFDRAS